MWRAIEFLKLFDKKNNFIPKGESRGFIASSAVSLDRDTVGRHNWTEKYQAKEYLRDKLHSERYIYAVAVLKVKVQSKTVFIIYHPEYFFKKPIVLVQGQPDDPLNTKSGSFNGAIYSFDFLSPNVEYVIVTKYQIGGHNLISGYDLIYLGESYCSGMETTDKRAILNPLKFIERRSNVRRSFGLRVDLKAAKSVLDISGTPTFTRYYTNEANVDIQQAIKFTKNANETLELTNEEKQALRAIGVKMKYKLSTLKDRFLRLNMIMIKDRQFIADIINLDNQYKQMKPH